MSGIYEGNWQTGGSTVLPYSSRFIAVTTLYIAVSTYCQGAGNIRDRNSRDTWLSFKTWFCSLEPREAKQWVIDAVKNHPGHTEAHYLLSKEGVWETFTSFLNAEFEPKN